MANIPTYVLAPNLTYHPNTSICMGDIIDDPTDPTRVLKSLNPLPSVENHHDYDGNYSREKVQSLRGSIWAKFLQTVEAKLEGGASNNVLAKYTFDRLETEYFTKQPTDAEAEEIVKDARVRTAVNSGILGKKPVYMISGLKIARGFGLTVDDTKKVDATASAKAPVSSQANVGLEVTGSNTDTVKMSHHTTEDIIFAYQLHVIAHKGWKNKNFEARVYKPKAAFLNEDEVLPEEDAVETSKATEEDLRAFDDDIDVEVQEVTDPNGPCVCLVFQE